MRHNRRTSRQRRMFILLDLASLRVLPNRGGFPTASTEIGLPSKVRLSFERVEVDGKSSVAFDVGTSASGIYAYRYSDESWYVGKSIDMARRYTQHLHEYRHSKDAVPTIKEAYFARFPDASPEELDNAETHAIQWFDRQGYSLRNKAKTSIPLGPGTITVTLGEDAGIPLPWRRSQRPLSRRPYEPDLNSMTNGMQARYERLIRLKSWQRIRMLLRAYVLATIPAPCETAGILWAISAMPSSRNARRLVTLTVQNLETLVIFDEGPSYGICGFFNMKRPEGALRRTFPRTSQANYAAAQGVVRLFCDDLEQMLLDIRHRSVCDWCYRLNVELMRKGSCMVRNRSNALLMQDVLSSL